MKLLLDSHAFLWWLADDPKLAKTAREALAAPSSIVHVSAATVWELTIKARRGKLDLGDTNLVEEIEENEFVELPMTAQHAFIAGSLPPHHEDPFDRMLIAQAKAEDLTIVTRDSVFRDYGVAILPT
jgi:PIN domain nuclease of toxin-antitoxin system